MRSATLPVFAGVLIGFVGWLVGRELSSPQRRGLSEAERSGAARGSNAEIAQGRERESADESFSASDFRAAAEQLPNPPDAAVLSKFFLLAQRMESQEFPTAMDELVRQDKTEWHAKELLEIWAERDVAGARVWFEAQPFEIQRNLFWSWGPAWARLDATNVRRWLTSRSEQERGKLDTSRIITVLAEIDPAAALELAGNYGSFSINDPITNSGARLPSHAGILGVWAKRDPAAAAAKALELPRGKLQLDAVQAVMREWTDQDAAGALAWVEQFSDAALANTARTVFVSALAVKDPIATADYIRTRVPEDEQGLRLRALAFYGEPSAVAELAREQADPETRRAMLSASPGHMGYAAGLWGWSPADNGPKPGWWNAAMDSERAAKLWLEESKALGTPLEHATDTAAALALQHGVKAAVNFLEAIPLEFTDAAKGAPEALAKVSSWREIAEGATQMPPSARRTEWIEKSVSGMLAQGELGAAQRLVDTLPAGTERDTATRALGAGLFKEDPEAAAGVLLSLPDGSTQLRESVAEWFKKDPHEARRWVAATEVFTPEERQQILAVRPTAPTQGTR